MRQSLGTAKACVGRPNRAGHCDHWPVTVEHDESCVSLVRQPTKRSKRYHPVRADHDQAPQTVTDARKTGFAPICADSVFKS
jgi:hypothetical protein